MPKFVIVNHYVKGNESKFYHFRSFFSNSIANAVSYFRNCRFYHTGTYRLFFLKEKIDKDTNVIIDVHPTFSDINNCLLTKVCKWTPDGDFKSSLLLGSSIEDFSEEDIFSLISNVQATVLPEVVE